jgi:hypothetical protein
MITMINQGINKNLFKINSHEDVYQSYEKETIVHLLVHRLKRAESVLRIASKCCLGIRRLCINFYIISPRLRSYGDNGNYKY